MLATTDASELTSRDTRLLHGFALLGDKSRFSIFKLLSKRSDMCVSQIAEELDISASAVSQHFKQFELLRMVDKVRIGQKICYRLNNDDTLVQKLLTITKE